MDTNGLPLKLQLNKGDSVEVEIKVSQGELASLGLEVTGDLESL